MKKRNQRGSAPLFVVMMAGALATLIAYGLAKLVSAAGLLSKSAQLEGEVDRLVREISGTIADPNTCPSAFRNALGNKVTINVASMPVAIDTIHAGYNNGRPIAKVNATTAGLVISSMNFKNPIQIRGSVWELTLELNLEKKVDATTFLMGSSVLIKKFRMSVALDGANQISACSPLGGRMATGPMSPLRSTSALMVDAECDDNTEMDNMCAALTPVAPTGQPPYAQTYFAATQGDLLGFGMLRGAVAVAPPTTIPGFAVRGLVRPHYGHGGASSWTMYDQANANGPCTVMCVHKDVPIRFTRTQLASNTALSGAGSKDALCKSEVGPKYVAASFNDFAQAGWSATNTDPGNGVVEQFPTTIAGSSNLIQLGAANVGSLKVMWNTGGTGNGYVACVRH